MLSNIPNPYPDYLPRLNQFVHKTYNSFLPGLEKVLYPLASVYKYLTNGGVVVFKQKNVRTTKLIIYVKYIQ